MHGIHPKPLTSKVLSDELGRLRARVGRLASTILHVHVRVHEDPVGVQLVVLPFCHVAPRQRVLP